MPIVKDNFQRQIYDILKAEILKKKRGLGDQINPRIIAEEHEISVTPVRDALLQLSNDGLVINRERVGFFVRDFSLQESMDIMEVRKMYELYCLENFFREIDRKHLSEIQTQMKAYPNISKDEFYDADAALHNLFVTASNNLFLIKEFNRLRDLFVLFIYFDTSTDDIANDEHISIIKAILNQDKDGSLEHLKNHLNRVKQVIMESSYFAKAM